MNRRFFAALVAVLTTQGVAAADFATEVMDATFKLGKGPSGTCFLMRREAPDTAVYLVTVAHAFDDNTEETAVLVFRKPTAEGTHERHEHPVLLRRGGKPLWARHKERDVAVLRIDEPLPASVAALPASALADEERLKTANIHVCSPLFIFGYPEGLEADAAGRPVARQAIFASSPLLPWKTHPTFLADYAAFQGDSGGPAFVLGAQGRPLVVGLVTEQHYYVTEVRKPLGVVKILHAQYIHETLEAAAHQSESVPQ
jgi:hypothetical protein